MCYRKLNSVRFLAVCVSLYFASTAYVEGFRFNQAKDEVAEFLGYLLDKLGYPQYDISDVQHSNNINELTATANQHITEEVLAEINWLQENEPEQYAQISEFYTEYQNALIQLLNADQRTVNREIPMAHMLANSLSIGHTEFKLAEAKEYIVTFLQYLYGLLGMVEYYDELTNAANNHLTDDEMVDICKKATGDDDEGDENTPAAMQIMNEDPIIRGRPLPLIDAITQISDWFPPQE